MVAVSDAETRRNEGTIVHLSSYNGTEFNRGNVELARQIYA
jgi:hypothetical protein